MKHDFTTEEIKAACKIIGGDLEFEGFNATNQPMFSIPENGNWILLNSAQQRTADVIAGMRATRSTEMLELLYTALGAAKVGDVLTPTTAKKIQSLIDKIEGA